MISGPRIFQNGQGFHFQGAEPGTSPPLGIPDNSYNPPMRARKRCFGKRIIVPYVSSLQERQRGKRGHPRSASIRNIHLIPLSMCSGSRHSLHLSFHRRFSWCEEIQQSKCHPHPCPCSIDPGSSPARGTSVGSHPEYIRIYTLIPAAGGCDRFYPGRIVIFIDYQLPDTGIPVSILKSRSSYHFPDKGKLRNCPCSLPGYIPAGSPGLHELPESRVDPAYHG